MKESKNIQFAFWGTPDVASKTLEILKQNGYLPSVIITSPDKKSGRGLNMCSTPVSNWAEANKINCLKPERIDDDFIKKFKEQKIELSIVVAYGKILPKDIIHFPKLGTINIHYSLLPKYRGASPVEQALLDNQNKTGISIQQMEFKLDSGPILAEEELNININDNKNDLRNNLIITGANLLSKIIPEIIENKITPKIQNEKNASYCTKIKKEDGEIKLHENGLKNYNKYRAFTGWPGTYFFIDKNNKKIRIKINKAKYENDSFIIERVTPEGRKEISYSDFLKSNI